MARAARINPFVTIPSCGDGMAAQQVPTVLKATARPILSASLHEARRRALNLYRAWYREVRPLQ